MQYHLIKKLFVHSISFVFLLACNQKKHLNEKEIVATPTDLNLSAKELIQDFLSDLNKQGLEYQPLLPIKYPELIQGVYKQNDFRPLWTNNGSWIAIGDSLFAFILKSRFYGLFPEDYHQEQLAALRDSISKGNAANENKLDATIWAKTDLLLTSAFVQIVKDLSWGRLIPDSTFAKDSLLKTSFFEENRQQFLRLQNTDAFAAQLESKIPGYVSLKKALKNFLATADFRKFTYINSADTTRLVQAVKKRLQEEDSVLVQEMNDTTGNDSITVAQAIRQYQRLKGLKEDGKISKALIWQLNETDSWKFVRIAITLDRYKLMPSKLPEQYIWVNIPAYRLKVMKNDSLVLESKVIIGKPSSRTPVLTSAISDIITYPQWTIPESIVKKEILPGLRKDPSYAQKRGFSLINRQGGVIDPYLVDWNAAHETLPYKVVQGSGDDNALGVIKFNFSNKYQVYLHDTNQRHLFNNKNRALSHGCVRVQNWKKLAYYIVANGSPAKKNQKFKDSLDTYLVRKERHVIPVYKKIPLYIRYFSCEGEDGRLVFYEDIYGDDNRLAKQFFLNKK